MKRDAEVMEMDVWDALEEDPKTAAVMRLRSEMMMALMRAARAADPSSSPAAVASLFRVDEETASSLLRGKINDFDTDTLIGMSTAAGIRVSVMK